MRGPIRFPPAAAWTALYVCLSMTGLCAADGSGALAAAFGTLALLALAATFRGPADSAFSIALSVLALTLPFGAPSVNAINEALVALGLIRVLYGKRRGPVLRAGGAETALLAYFAVGVLCAAFGVSFADSLGRLKSELHLLFAFFLFAAAFAEAPAPGPLRLFALGFAAAACYGISQPITFYYTHTGVMMARALVHHISFGEMLALALCGGLAAWEFPSALGAPSAVKPRALAFCLLLWVALILSQARGPWLAFGAAFLTLAALRKELRTLLTAAAASVVVLMAVPPFYQRFASIFDPAQHANAVRFELWKLAWRMFLDHPVFGVGPANFGTLFHVYYPGKLGEADVWTQVHNLYLHQLAERGLVGFAMLLVLFGVLTGRAWRTYRRRPDFWSLWRLGAMAALWVMNFTQNSFHTASVWMLLVFLWAWCERNCAGAGREAAHD